MNNSTTPAFITDFTRDLRGYLSLCEEVMDLAHRENQALSSQAEYHPSEFHQTRKSLLPRLKEAFILLHGWRKTWQEISPGERGSYSEVKMLFQSVQGMLMKVLLLDRENQQALLRRGLVPARQLHQASAQKPHFVASVYKRHSSR